MAINATDQNAEDNQPFLLFVYINDLLIVASVVISLIGYMVTAFRIKTALASTDYVEMRIYKLFLYTIVILLTFVPCSIIGRLENGGMIFPQWVKYAQIALMQSLGFSNALIYGVQSNIYKHQSVLTQTEGRKSEHEMSMNEALRMESYKGSNDYGPYY